MTAEHKQSILTHCLRMAKVDRSGICDLGGGMVRGKRTVATEEPAGKGAAGNGTAEDADTETGYHHRIVGTVWLVVATGGWWKAREIADATGLDHDCLHNRLNYMTQRRYLERRILAKEQRANTGAMGARERAEFSVSPACMVPGGLTAAEVSQAVAGVL